MRRTIIYLFSLFGILSFFASCADQEIFSWGKELETDNELPVEFTLLLPDDKPSMRGIEYPKKAFANGDVIHIEGTFTPVKEGTTDTIIRYGAMMYNGKQWHPVAGSTLKWPNSVGGETDVKGQFHAYFISKSTGILYHPDSVENKSSTDVYMLSDIEPGTETNSTAVTDPLEAISAENILYGRAVGLQFHHICTYLTLIELEPMVAQEYWFTRQNTTLNNAFKLLLGRDNKLYFSFLSVPDSTGLAYISSPAIEMDTVLVDGKTIKKANYFLQPDFYKTFELRYPAGSLGSYPYLQYDYDKIPEDVGGKENTPPDLKAGTTYTLNITKSPGITITTPPDAEGWDESDIYYEVDVDEFLKAVANGDKYTWKDQDSTVLILEPPATGTRLLHNVDFRFAKYSLLEGDASNPYFEPNVNLGQTFDGGFHYIRNLGSPLFRQNHGTIKDVGLKKIKATFISDENDESGHDMSRQGGLCMWNRTTGVIENVRICDGVDITAKVKTDEDQETHNIGCVIGSNTGKVTEVSLSGNFKLTVEAYVNDNYTDEVDATVIIGGIVGQNAGTGSISDISIYNNNLNMTITNKCQGNIGAFYVGGIVGQNSGYIDGVTLQNVTIDGTESKGIVSYMGCMIGGMEAESEGSSAVTSCIVSGTVKAGTVNPSGDLTSESYIGGIAGTVMNVPVTDCRVAASVYGTTSKVDNVTYATGGAFGVIRTATTMSNLIAYGSALEGVEKYIGNFAGIVPQGHTWEDHYARNNIIVRQFNNYENIGTDK